MRAEFTQPAPDLGSVGWRAIPPDWSRYEPPPPSVVGRLAGNARYRQQLADARAAYEAAMAEYERAEAERQRRFDEARRRYVTRLAEERRRVEEHNRSRGRVRRGAASAGAGAVARYLGMVLDAGAVPAAFPRSAEVSWPAGASGRWSGSSCPARRWCRRPPRSATTARPTSCASCRGRPTRSRRCTGRWWPRSCCCACGTCSCADPGLDAVTFVGQVRGVEVIRVDTRRAAVEVLAGLDLPPDAALATLSILDPAAELRWAS